MVAIVAFLVLVLCAVPIEHMAFGRHPALVGNELARRGIGIATVMALGLIPVLFGGLDWATWAALLAGFALAGLVLGLMVSWERQRERAARVEQTRRGIHEQIEQWIGDSATETTD